MGNPDYANPQAAEKLIRDKNILILGYGNQARPQALNLKDGEFNVAVGLRPDSPSADLAKSEGLAILTLEDGFHWADVILALIPDEKIPQLYGQYQATIANGGERRKKYIGFAHGLAIHAGWIDPDPDTNLFLVAPKAQGRGVRDKFIAGKGVPALVAVHQDTAGDTETIATGYAVGALGSHHAGIFKTTFREETECDLFTEQTLLCGGLSALIQSAYEVLLEAGYSPETAWFECVYEVKLLADLIHERGITGMREAISPAARFGDLTRGGRVIDPHVKENMEHVLADIQSGRFMAELKAEGETGYPLTRQLMAKGAQHPVDIASEKMLAILSGKAEAHSGV